MHLVSHFVKLVNAADAVVSKNKSTGLKNQLTSFRVLCDISSQADGGRAFTRSVLRPWHQVKDVLQELGLRCAWVTAEQDVDFSTEFSASSREQLFLGSTEELQKDS